MEIHFNGEYDKAIFTRALKLTERKKIWVTLSRYLAVLFGILVIAQAINVWLYESPNGFEIARLGRHIFTVLLLAIYYTSPILSRKQTVDNLFRNTPLRPSRGRATPEGIFIRGVTSPKEGFFPWNRFIRKGRLDDLIALKTIDGALAIFCEHYFENKADWQRFQQWVDQYVIEPK